MPLDVTLSFPDSPEAEAIALAGLKVRRYTLHQALCALFELTIDVLSPDPAVAEEAVVGQRIVVEFGDEPFLRRVTGIIREVTQRSSVVGGESLYSWTIAPPHWLTVKRRDHRIFQDLSVPEIVAAVLADPAYAGRIPSPRCTFAEAHDRREYVVQYGEADWHFISRLLAAEGISSYFDHGAESAWVLVDDTAALSPEGSATAVPFRETTRLQAQREHRGETTAPHVLAAVVTTAIEASSATVRDYDFEKPDLVLEAARHASPGSSSMAGLCLDAYRFEVGAFGTRASGDERAQRVLDASRSSRRRVLCASSFTLAPGFCMSLADHPRPDLCASLLVVGARTVMEGDQRGVHELTLIDRATRFRPPFADKPRIAGTQTAAVVGAEGEEIDVDNHGRVLVEFRWDRRDQRAGKTSRRVRVAQGWAGADRGFVTLPRVGDEVVVAYLDGDPDQPIIVGRVHNGMRTAPIHLPADKTVSVWRSRSTPGGAGHNEVLMDDAAGAERLELRAQQDMRTEALRDAVTIVGRNQQVTVRGAWATTVRGDSSSRVQGAQRHEVVDQCSVAGTDVYADFTDLEVKADSILLRTEGAKIHMTSGAITIEAPVIKLSASGSTIAMAGDVDIEGTPIRLNC